MQTFARRIQGQGAALTSDIRHLEGEPELNVDCIITQKKLCSLSALKILCWLWILISVAHKMCYYIHSPKMMVIFMTQCPMV